MDGKPEPQCLPSRLLFSEHNVLVCFAGKFHPNLHPGSGNNKLAFARTAIGCRSGVPCVGLTVCGVCIGWLVGRRFVSGLCMWIKTTTTTKVTARPCQMQRGRRGGVNCASESELTSQV